MHQNIKIISVFDYLGISPSSFVTKVFFLSFMPMPQLTEQGLQFPNSDQMHSSSFPTATVKFYNSFNGKMRWLNSRVVGFESRNLGFKSLPFLFQVIHLQVNAM